MYGRADLALGSAAEQETGFGFWVRIGASRPHGCGPVEVSAEEADMELKMQLNVVAAALSFAFVAAITLGLI
jgi:hypothetical protein